MFDPSPRLVGAPPSADQLAGMTDAEAFAFVIGMRWPGRQPICPVCGSDKVYSITTRRKFKCKAAGHQFSPVSGTVFASFKGGYLSLLKRMAHTGTIESTTASTSKTALDVRRRREANDRTK